MVAFDINAEKAALINSKLVPIEDIDIIDLQRQRELNLLKEIFFVKIYSRNQMQKSKKLQYRNIK